MALGWLDVTTLSFNSLLLLERVQISWFPGWLPEKELAIALQANPVVEWYLRHKCPEIETWMDGVAAQAPAEPLTPEALRQAEVGVLSNIEDLLVYVVNPEIYDAQPFLGWDFRRITFAYRLHGQGRHRHRLGHRQAGAGGRAAGARRVCRRAGGKPAPLYPGQSPKTRLCECLSPRRPDHRATVPGCLRRCCYGRARLRRPARTGIPGDAARHPARRDARSSARVRALPRTQPTIFS